MCKCVNNFKSLEEAKKALKTSFYGFLISLFLAMIYWNRSIAWLFRVPKWYRNLVGDRIVEISMHISSMSLPIMFLIGGISALIYIIHNNPNKLE